MRSGSLAFGIALVVCVHVIAQPALSRPPLVKENGTIKLSEHVYVIPDDSVPLVPNVGIIVGARATLVVDSGLGPRNGAAILREATKIRPNNELYLMSTHFHPEHALGETAFPATAKVVRAQVQQKDIDQSGRDLAVAFSRFGPAAADLLKDAQFRPADILFDRDYALDLGGVRARLFWRGSMHTPGDTLVFVEGDEVLFAGDVVMNRAFLAFSPSSSLMTWLSVLDELGRLHPKKVVPSHGETGDGTLVGQDRDLLTALQARVRELKGQGRAADEIGRLMVSEFQMKYPDWTGPNRVAAAARAAYMELP
jgi:glyoxylase-like metal-dependent hydrolase (beta-lactamase superfamily II)